jgi:hypothetical protein
MKLSMNANDSAPRTRATPPPPAAPARLDAGIPGMAADPVVRPQKRRGRSRCGNDLEQRIERLASTNTEFKGNLRKPAGFLDVFLELVDLMGPELLATSTGFDAPASHRF